MDYSVKAELEVLSTMSESSAQDKRPLDVAIDFLDKVDEDLAEIQAEEVFFWRIGTIALLAGGFALGVGVLVILALQVRRLFGTPVAT